MMPCALTSCLRHALRPAGACLASSATSVRMDALNRLMSFVEAASVLSVCLRLACVASLIPSDCGTIAAASSPLKAGSALLSVQIGDVQPWRLFDVRHQCVHDGRIRVAVQADQQIAFRIRLLHLVERALRDESRETPGRCSLAVRFGVGTGRLALCKVGKHALRGQYGDVAGVGGYYGLAGFRGGRIILFEIMRRRSNCRCPAMHTWSYSRSGHPTPIDSFSRPVRRSIARRRRLPNHRFCCRSARNRR